MSHIGVTHWEKEALSLCSHVYRRGAIYWYRRRIPVALLELYPGKQDIAFSLKTTDPKEAKIKSRIEAVKVDQEFAEAARKKARAVQAQAFAAYAAFAASPHALAVTAATVPAKPLPSSPPSLSALIIGEAGESEKEREETMAREKASAAVAEASAIPPVVPVVPVVGDLPTNSMPSPCSTPSCTVFTEAEIERLAILYRHEALKKDEQDHHQIPVPDSPQTLKARQDWQEHQDFLKGLHEGAGHIYTPEPFNISYVLEKTMQAKRAYAEQFISLAGPALSNGNTSLIEHEARNFLVAQGIDVDILDYQSFHSLCFKLLQTALDVQRIIQERLAGTWVETPSPSAIMAVPPYSHQGYQQQQYPAIAPPPGYGVNGGGAYGGGVMNEQASQGYAGTDPRRESKNNPRLSKLWDKYLAERQPAIRTAQDFGTMIRRFIELVGNMPVQSVRAQHIRDFKDALMRMPSNRSKTLNALPLPLLLKQVEKDKKKGMAYTLLAPKTINDKGLTAIKTLLGYAVNNGFIETNPAYNIRTVSKAIKSRQGAFFTIDELNTIFSSAWFTDPPLSAPFKQAERLDYQWIILLALFTGARREEIGQLAISDIREEKGIPFIFITDNEEKGQKLKTESSRRKVPVHPRLIELGFLDFVEAKRKRANEAEGGGVANGGVARLFDTLTYTESSDTCTKKFGQDFSRFLSIIEIKASGKVFHSFRHSFKWYMRNTAGVNEDFVDAMQGHTSDRGVAGSYGLDADGMGYSMPVLLAALEKWKLEEVVIPRPPLPKEEKITRPPIRQQRRSKGDLIIINKGGRRRTTKNNE